MFEGFQGCPAPSGVPDRGNYSRWEWQQKQSVFRSVRFECKNLLHYFPPIKLLLVNIKYFRIFEFQTIRQENIIGKT